MRGGRAALAFALVGAAAITLCACVVLGGFDDGPFVTGEGDGAAVDAAVDRDPLACGPLPPAREGGPIPCGDVGFCDAGTSCCAATSGAYCSTDICPRPQINVRCQLPSDCFSSLCCIAGTPVKYTRGACSVTTPDHTVCQIGKCDLDEIPMCGVGAPCEAGICVSQNTGGFIYGLCVPE